MTVTIRPRIALASGAILVGIVLTGTIGLVVLCPSDTAKIDSSDQLDEPRDIGVSCGLDNRDELPLPEGVDGKVGELSISDSGEYVAGTPGNNLVRWRNSEPEVLDRGVGTAVDINDSGDIVGAGDDNDSIWVYRDDNLMPLWPKTAGTVDARGQNRSALSIRDDGAVLASVWMTEAESSQILIWEPGQEKPTRLDFDGNEPRYVMDFGAHGNAVGGADRANSSTPMVWDVANATAHTLPRPSKTSSGLARSSRLEHVDNRWAVSQHGVLWDLSAPAAAPRGVTEDFDAHDVDSQGIVYGEDSESDAIQYRDADGIGELPMPRADDMPPTLDCVNSAGTTAVGRDDDNDNAYIWTCR